MSTGFWWVFDLLVILIVVRVIWSNGKRGFSKVLILNIGYILTTLLASVLAAVAAPTLYNSVANQTNISGIETANQHTDFVKLFTQAMEKKQYGFQIDAKKVEGYVTGEDRLDFDTQLYHYANRMTGAPVSTKGQFRIAMREEFIAVYGKELGERLPKYVKMYFEEMTLEDPTLMCEIVDYYYDPKLTAAEKAAAIEDKIARKPTTEVLQIFIYFILFSVIMIIIAIISSAAQKKIFFNIYGSTDHVMGGVIGILEAGAMLVLLTLLVRLIVMLTGGEFLCFNHKTIYESKIFSFLYINISRLL